MPLHPFADGLLTFRINTRRIAASMRLGGITACAAIARDQFPHQTRADDKALGELSYGAFAMLIASKTFLRKSNAMVRTKSGSHRAVDPEFIISGVIFHPSRVKSSLLNQAIQQAFIELTRLPTGHREDLWCVA
jgi:hypothetical protein